MKLPWPFLPFVSSLLCPHEQGVDTVRTLYRQEGGGQFILIFCGCLLWTAPYEIIYTAKKCSLDKNITSK